MNVQRFLQHARSAGADVSSTDVHDGDIYVAFEDDGIVLRIKVRGGLFHSLKVEQGSVGPFGATTFKTLKSVAHYLELA